MGEKGNVADAAGAAPGLVDRGVDLAQSGVGVATGVVVAGVTGAASGAIQDRIEEKIAPDDEEPEAPAT